VGDTAVAGTAAVASKRDMVFDRFDTNIEDDPAGIARVQMAKESKARQAKKAKALAEHAASRKKAISNTKAAGDDDIMDEEAGRMRIQLAEESRQRKEEEATALKASNDELKGKLKSAKPAYLTHAGSSIGANALTYAEYTASKNYQRAIPIARNRSPTQQQRHEFYPVYGKGGAKLPRDDDQSQLW